MTHLISAISTPQPVLKDVLLFVTLLFFLTSSLQQHALYRAPFHSLLLPSGFYCPVLCLTSLIKFPHVIKLHFQRRNSLQSLPDLSFFPLSFFFLFPPGSVCAHQPVGLCFRACLCLDRFMKLCGICQNKKNGGDRRGRQVSGVAGFYGREMQNELRSENAQCRFMYNPVTCPSADLMLNKFAHRHRASKIIRGRDIIKIKKYRHRLSLHQSVGFF